MWTVFVFAFLKFLSALGLKSSTARQQPTMQRLLTPPPAPFIPATAEPLRWELPYELSYELPYGLPYEGFLPPTIKQRIRAEAHGATPTSRHVSRGSAEVSHADPLVSHADPLVSHAGPFVSHADPLGAAATATIPATPHRMRPLCLT